MATQIATMLIGQVAMPASVSGVATAPIDMPSAMKNVRASQVGTKIGRPASAATAENNMDPEIQPAGKPAQVKAAPPTAPIANDSAIRSTIRRRFFAAGIGR